MKVMRGVLLIALSMPVFANGTVIEDIAACMHKGTASEEFSKIAGKVFATGGGGFTFEMLSNSSRPTPAEKKQIAAWVKYVDDCHQKTDLYTNPEYDQISVGLFRSDFTARQLGLAKLHSGKTTYGEYAQQRADDYAKLEKEYDARANELAALKQAEQDRAAHEANARWEAEQQQAHRQAQHAAMQEQHRLQAMQHGIDSFRRSMDRNFPQPVNCTSTNSFGVVSTNCR